MSARNFLLLLALAIAGCASTGERDRDPARHDACFDCGRIIDISQQAGRSAGRAALAAPSAGPGHHGALGGINLGSVAVPDFAAPGSGFDTRVYNVKVLLDNGGIRSLVLDDVFGLAIGARVRLIGDQIMLDQTRALNHPGAD
jgi:hypothetical protein